jgi:tetratricopeptide (TPR) repeat protein
VLAGCAACLLSTCGAAVAASEYDSVPTPKLRTMAEEAFKERKLDAVGRMCDVLLSRAAGDNQAYILKANCLDDTGNLPAAVALLEGYLQKFAPDGPVLTQLGIFYTSQQKYDQAINCFNRSLKVEPLNADALHRRSMVYSTQKKYPEAIKDLTMVIKLRPGSGRAYQWRASAYEQVGDYASAIADLGKAIQLPNKNRIEYYIVRADLYAKLKHYKEAIADYDTVLKANALDDTVLYKKGQTLMQLKDYKGAVDAFTAVLDIADLSTAYYARSQAYEKLNNHAAALKDKQEGDRLAKKRAIERI